MSIKGRTIGAVAGVLFGSVLYYGYQFDIRVMYLRNSYKTPFLGSNMTPSSYTSKAHEQFYYKILLRSLLPVEHGITFPFDWCALAPVNPGRSQVMSFSETEISEKYFPWPITTANSPPLGKIEISPSNQVFIVIPDYLPFFCISFYNHCRLRQHMSMLDFIPWF